MNGQGNGMMGLLPLLLLCAGQQKKMLQAEVKDEEGNVLVETAAYTAQPVLSGINIRALLEDVAPFLPAAEAGSIGRMAQLMGIAEELRGVRETPLLAAAPNQRGINPMQRSMGLLGALKKNIPAMDNPQLNRLEQMAGMVQKIQSISSLGLNNIVNTLSNMALPQGNALELAENLLGGIAGERERGGGPNGAAIVGEKAEHGNLQDTISRAFLGMDEAQKQRLLEMAHSFLGK